MTVVVAVDKCTDPLQVNITVTDGQAVVVLESTVTSASDLQDNSYTIDTFARDDQTFTISVRCMIARGAGHILYASCQCSQLKFFSDLELHMQRTGLVFH